MLLKPNLAGANNPNFQMELSSSHLTWQGPGKWSYALKPNLAGAPEPNLTIVMAKNVLKQPLKYVHVLIKYVHVL